MLDHTTCLEMSNNIPISQPKTLLSRLSRNNLRKLLLFRKVKPASINIGDIVKDTVVSIDANETIILDSFPPEHRNEDNINADLIKLNSNKTCDDETTRVADYSTVHDKSSKQSINSTENSNHSSNLSSVETIALDAAAERKTSLDSNYTEASCSGHTSSANFSQPENYADDEYESGPEPIDQPNNQHSATNIALALITKPAKVSQEKSEEDEYILESLRQVVRVCTNNDQAKKISSGEILKLLDDVYMKTVPLHSRKTTPTQSNHKTYHRRRTKHAHVEDKEANEIRPK